MQLTPKTDSVLSGINQLPDISTIAAVSMVHKLRKAEIAMQEAEAAFTAALHDIADEISDSNDGWKFDEIWKTDLRGNTEIMRRLRSKGLDA